MREVELPGGGIAEFPDEMSDEQISAVLRKQFAPKETSWTDVVKQSLGEAGRTINTGAHMTGIGASQFIEDLTGKSPLAGLESLVRGRDVDPVEAKNMAFNNMEAINKRIQEATNPNNATMNMPQSVVGAAATLPAQLLGMPFQPAMRGKEMVDLGETNTGKIQAAMGVDTLANAAGIAAPVSMPGSLLKRFATGAGANVALSGVSDQAAKDLSETAASKKAMDPFSEEGQKRMAVAGIVGGMLGATMGPRSKPRQSPGSATQKARDLIAQKKNPQPTPENPLPQLLPEMKAELDTLPPGIPKLDDVETPLPRIIDPDAVPNLPDTRITGKEKMGDAKVSTLPKYKEGALETAKTDALTREGEFADIATERLKEGYETLANEPSPFQKAMRRQAGYIDPDLLTGGVTKLMRAGMRGFDLFKKFEGTFNERSMIQAARKAADPDSRETIIWMRPDEFHTSAAKRTILDGFQETKRKDVRKGLDTKEGLNDIPFLWVSIRDGELKVIGHEGRHRMDVFAERGVDKIPVRVMFGDSTGWKNADPLPRVIDEQGNKIDLNSFERVFPDRNIPADYISKANEDKAPPLREIRDPWDIPTTSMDEFNLRMAGESSSIRNKPITFMQKQRGAIDFNDAAPRFPADKAKKAAENSTSDLAKPEQRQQAVAKLTDIDLADFVAKDTPVENVVEALRTLPDMEGPWWLIGGKEMVAKIKNNPAVYAVGQWFNNARNRFELANKTMLKPAEQAVNRLLQSKEGADVLGVMKEEMFNKVKLTPEELDQIGFSRTQKEAYLALRKAYDDVYAKVNEKRLELGLDPFAYHDAYFASTWHGDWKTPVYNKEGKLVWYIAETSKNRANAALATLKKQFPDLDYAKSKIEYTKKPFNTEGRYDVGAMYKDLLKILGEDDPTVQQIRTWYEATLQDEAYGTLGIGKHAEPKAGVRGFQGDRPWGGKADVRYAFKEQMAYLRNSLLWAEMQTAVENTKKVMSDPELKVTHENTLNYVREMSRNELGFGANQAWSNFEKSVARWLGEGMSSKLTKDLPLIKNLPTDLSSINKGLGVSKSIFYLKNLGVFNAPFAFISMVQPIFTIPHHIDLALKGYKYNPFLNTVNSSYAWSATVIENYRNILAEHTGAKLPSALDGLDPFYQKAHHYLEANQVAQMSQLSEVRDLGRSEALQTGEKILGITIVEPEFLARTKTYYEFVDHLKQSGKFTDDMQIFEKAHELTKITMGNYAHNERAGIFNKLGTTGNAASTLKTYPINQMNQLYSFSKDAYNGIKAGKPEAALPMMAMLGLQGALAGAMGFYGMETLEVLWNLMKSGYLAMGGTNKGFVETSPKTAILENADSLYSHGLVSNITGMNFSARMDMGTILDPTMEGLFPFLSDGMNIAGSTLKFLADPTNKEKLDRMLYAASPASLKGFAEMNLGTLTDEQGNMMKISDPGMKIADRTEFDKKTRGIPFWGMPSLREGHIKEGAYRFLPRETAINKAKQNLGKKFDSAIRAGDTAKIQEILIQYAEEYQDPRPLLRQLKPDALKRLLTQQQQMLLRAKTPTSIQRYQRYMEIMQGVQQDN